MRKINMSILSVMTAIGVFIIVAGIADAGIITGSKHDLSSGTGGAYKMSGAGADQICAFCHTPHFGSSATANLPLWNRTTTTSGYTMYTSATMDMTVAAQPQGVSAACLSCHDGVVAVDQLINKPGSGVGASTLTSTLTNNKLNAAQNPAAYLSQDLSNDHPVSITYDPTKDTKFNVASSGKVGALPLYGTAKNQVECGTCHNVHDPSVAPFLRSSNAGSALCLTCHIT
jgi:predicted CXXCH cytochrome family protein